MLYMTDVAHGRSNSATQAVLILLAIGTITSVTTVTTFWKGGRRLTVGTQVYVSPPISVSLRGW